MGLDRREVLKLVAGSSLAALAPAFARAQTVGGGSGYRATVMLFLYGGNDANNMIVPTGARHADYARLRGDALAIPQASLTPLTGTNFGLNPAMSDLASIWDQGALSWVLNSGPLIEPITRDQYNNSPSLRPANLFSHDAQQNLWQTAGAQSELTTGWLGRIGDRYVDAGVRNPSVSLAGSQRSLIGDRNSPILISGNNLSLYGFSPTDTSTRTTTRRAAFDAMLTGTQGSRLADITAAIMQGDLDAGAILNDVINGSTSIVDANFLDANGNAVNSSLATQLKRVARLIEGRDRLSATRQTFVVSTGGFDTHRDQVGGEATNGTHAGLLNNVARCAHGFWNVMKALSMDADVTLFTMSDFNRVFEGNGSRGSDHAWGAHHFVVGGGLNGSQLLGRYPELALGGPDDARDDGRWIPAVSVEEYGGALARWLGVSDADMPYVFPNWSNWNGGGRGPIPLFA